MRRLSGHRRDVRAVAFTPDGRVVSGGGDNTLRVWDAATGDCLVVVKAKGPVYAVAASPDGATVAYAGRAAPRAESNFVYLCDPAGKPLGRYEMRFLADRVRWDNDAGQLVRFLGADARSIWSLAFSADGTYLAAACRRMGGGNVPDGGGGRVWAVRPGADHPGTPLPDDAYAVAFAPAGHRFAVTRLRAVAFHEDPAGLERVRYPITAMWSPAVAFVPGAELAAVGSNSFLYFEIPDRDRADKPAVVKTGVRTVSALAASPDGKTLLVGGRPGAVEVYDVATRTRTTTYDFGIGGLQAVAFAPDGLTFAAAGDAGLVVCDAPG